MYCNEMLVTFAKGRPTNRCSLLPFGDLQVGSPLFHEPTWQDYVKAVQAAVNPITIGMGDYTDHFRPTVQARLQTAVGSDGESKKTLEEMHREFMDTKIIPLLLPVVQASACLGLLEGHHDMTYSDGTTSTQHLCRKLGVPYLGRGEAMIRVNLKWGCAGRRVLSFDLWASHGEGHGSTVGTPVGKLQRLLAYMDVDVALRGHSCDKFIFQEPQYYLSDGNPPKLRQRNRIIANCGGFSDSRIEGIDTYVERANMLPKAMGWVEIHINVRREPGGKNGYKGEGAAYLVMGD